jgi:hypothetical protein
MKIILLISFFFKFIFLATDEMKREVAIAEDFWRDLLKQIEEKTK